MGGVRHSIGRGKRGKKCTPQVNGNQHPFFLIPGRSMPSQGVKLKQVIMAEARTCASVGSGAHERLNHAALAHVHSLGGHWPACDQRKGAGCHLTGGCFPCLFCHALCCGAHPPRTLKMNVAAHSPRSTPCTRRNGHPLAHHPQRVCTPIALQCLKSSSGG